jgi:hypothetical protein
VFLGGLPKLETILIVIFANLIIIIFTDFSPAENSYKLINEREYDCHYRKLKYCNIPFIKNIKRGSVGESNECTRVPSHRAKSRSRERIKVKPSTEPREQKPSEPQPPKEPGERSSNPRIYNNFHYIKLKTTKPISYQNKQKTRQTRIMRLKRPQPTKHGSQ